MKLPLARRIWDSIVLRGPVIPRTDRDRAFVTIHTLLLHLRPVKVPARAIGFTHTFGLGGSSAVLLGLLVVSGLLMTLVYQPAPGVAFDSVVRIERDVRFGTLVRAMHYWSANLLVLVVVAHAARVFLTGGYHGARQFNWVVGVALLAMVLGSAFTGYLLPWDQLSYWAVTISTGMLGYVPVIGERLQHVARGGADIGASTLVVFYTTHTSILPALFVAMLSFHFWRVRKAGGVVLPPAATGGSDDEKVLFVPHLLVREVMLALAIAAVVVLLGAAVGAPLGERANPGMSPNPAKAPWYFMGLQELLVHVHPVVAVVVIPCLAALALVLLPYVTADDEPTGTWFQSDRGRRAAGWGALVALVVVPLWVLAHEFAAPHLPAWRGAAAVVAGLLPLAFVVAGGLAFGRFVQRWHVLRRNEVTQALVVLYVVGFAALTAIGVWFRGAHMALVWPWTR